MRKLRNLLLCLIAAVFFLIPVHADNSTRVYDVYGLLDEYEIEELNARAEEISQNYRVGVYIRVYADMEGYDNIEDYAEYIYSSEDLGWDDNAVMLILDMDTRSYDIMAHGDLCNAAFTDYGKSMIVDDILYYLSSGDFYEGFDTFLSDCESYLYSYVYEDEPVDTWIPDNEPEDPEVVAARQKKMHNTITLTVPPVIALIICLVLRSKNKTKAVATDARNYISKQNGVNLLGHQDIFLYRTQTVTRIHDDDHGSGGGHFGGTSVNSGGFSHSSGHF